jgi:hypothetical protein
VTGNRTEEDVVVIEAQWARLRAEAPATIAPLVEAAAEVPALRALFPFTQHDALGFSRTAGYPFSYDCPSAEPIANLMLLAMLKSSSDALERWQNKPEADLASFRRKILELIGPKLIDLGLTLEESGDQFVLQQSDGTPVGSGGLGDIREIVGNLAPRFRVYDPTGGLVGVGGVKEALGMLIMALARN